MSYENPVLTKGGKAAADLSANIHFAVKVDSNGRYAAVTTAGEVVAGVLQNKPSALDRSVSVMVQGITKMVASEAIPAMSLIGVSANGRARVARSGDFIVGVSQEEAASAAGQIIPVLLSLAQREAGPFVLAGTAAADFSAGVGKAVKFDGSGNIVLASSAGENVLGILQANAANGAACRVVQGGYATGALGATVTRGAKLATTAAGLLETAATGDHVCGIALESGVNGASVSILVTLGGAPLP